jgi:hypothetical protein
MKPFGLDGLTVQDISESELTLQVFLQTRKELVMAGRSVPRLGIDSPSNPFIKPMFKPFRSVSSDTLI